MYRERKCIITETTEEKKEGHNKKCFATVRGK